MVIDIHIHCYPDEVAKRSVAARAERFRIKPETDGTVDGLKQAMKDAGVDIGVIQPIAMRPEQTVKMNRWAAEISGGSVMSFGTIHPDYAHRSQEIHWLVDHGFKGVKFHADCQGYDADHPHMLKVYEEVFGAGLVILFHSGDDRAFTEPFRCTPVRLAKILDTFPGAPMIAAHMGGMGYWEEAEKHLVGRQIYMDTAYSIHQMGKPWSERFIRSHGAERILFGTDSPWRHPDMDISLIKALDLKKEEIDRILGDNAAKLLGIQR